MKRVRVTVSGMVQGVMFRESLRRRAAELRVRGHVRNLDDGRVEAVFEGQPHAVEEAVAWIREGPPLARVSDLELDEEPPQGDERCEIR